VSAYADALSLIGFLALLVIVAARMSGGFWKWFRGELDMLSRETWDFIETDRRLLTTRHDGRCRRMVIRQRSAGVYMRREGITPRVAISSACPHPTRFSRTVR
jgi:hypothetical protein